MPGSHGTRFLGLPYRVRRTLVEDTACTDTEDTKHKHALTGV